MSERVSFQGELGANSHVACREAFPALEALPCATFEDAFAAVSGGAARYAMIPIENSVAGRVADVHHLLPDAGQNAKDEGFVPVRHAGSGLYIVGERFAPIRHQLVGPRGARLADVRRVRSHVHALGQCRNTLAEMGLSTLITADTAGAAREVAELNDPGEAALASTLAAEIYGLDIIKPDLADAAHNTTRFLIFSEEPDAPAPDAGPVMTSFVFRVRNVPAALYKALGGFATNGVNMTKLESYVDGARFNVAMFYADIEGHPSDRPVRLALEELLFFTSMLKVLGVYRADPFRGRNP